MTITCNEEVNELIALLSQDYEVYENPSLNGTNVDYLFLEKNKGAIFLNIATDPIQLQTCKALDNSLDNLYLPEKYKKYVSAFILEIQNNQYSLYKKIGQKYFYCYSENSRKLSLTFKENVDFPTVTNNQDEACEDASNLYNCIKPYICVNDNNEDFFINPSKDQMSIVIDNKKRIREIRTNKKATNWRNKKYDRI